MPYGSERESKSNNATPAFFCAKATKPVIVLGLARFGVQFLRGNRVDGSSWPT